MEKKEHNQVNDVINLEKSELYMAEIYNIIDDKEKILVVFSLPFIVLYFHLNERANLIDDFNKNKELICNMSSLKIDVSKADNWSVDKNSFFKGSTSIPVTKCEIKD